MESCRELAPVLSAIHGNRTIIHADLDAFYASVEQLDHPELRGRPVVVGGSPEGRGVVAAASYEARAFGVRSAMPMVRALRLCPEAVRVSPRFDRYAVMSKRVMAVFRALTPLVEPLSFDEAFLDVSGWVADGADPAHLARELKREVKEKTQLTLSVGVASNKSVAKIASDLRKPDGLVVVRAGDEAEFLAPLPIRVLWGVGPKTEHALHLAGVRTIGDLARRSLADAERLLGSHGAALHAMARGADERPVETERERKSVGAETTFAQDLPDGPELRTKLHEIAGEVASRLAASHVKAQTVALKLRYADFHTVTRQSSPKAATDDALDIETIGRALLDAVVTDGDRFRLLGIQCSRLVEHAPQGVLWRDAENEATPTT
jgi:DNA polymerase-4